MASSIILRLMRNRSQFVVPCLAPHRWQSSVAGTMHEATSAKEMNYKLRVDLAVAYRAMDYYKLGEGVCNHLTLRSPAMTGHGDVMLLIKYGVHWSQVTASSLVGVDFDSGEVIEGEGRVQYAASNIHRAIHKAKVSEGVTCVMHTHQPYATTLACIKGGRLRNIHQNSMRFHERISYDDVYGGFADDKESEAIAKFLGDKPIALMGNHGVVATGNRVCDVFDDLYYLERAAMIQVLAMSTGEELLEVSDKLAVQVRDADFTECAMAHFNAIKDVLSGVKPDYRS